MLRDLCPLRCTGRRSGVDVDEVDGLRDGGQPSEDASVFRRCTRLGTDGETQRTSAGLPARIRRRWSPRPLRPQPSASDHSWVCSETVGQGPNRKLVTQVDSFTSNTNTPASNQFGASGADWGPVFTASVSPGVRLVDVAVAVGDRATEKPDVLRERGVPRALRPCWSGVRKRSSRGVAEPRTSRTHAVCSPVGRAPAGASCHLGAAAVAQHVSPQGSARVPRDCGTDSGTLHLIVAPW